MLSYKHGYHAGNHADVMKHIIMLYLYNLEKKVNNSISYIDTHSGNGIYKYISKYMDKNKEYKEGIKKIQNYKGNNILIKNYLSTISKITGKNNFYPGSPIFISSIANKKDKLFFCELHKNEYELLKKNLNKFTNTKILNADGFNFIFNKINKDKNYFVFIDPSSLYWEEAVSTVTTFIELSVTVDICPILTPSTNKESPSVLDVAPFIE